jgi:hypothetical protein
VLIKRTVALRLASGMLLSTLAVTTLLVNVGTANPFMPSGSWSDEPIPPSIDIQSPSEKLHYWTGSDVWLDFTVNVPLTPWYSPSMKPYPDHYATTFGTISRVRFSIDGKAENNTDRVSEYQGILTFSVNLGRLSVGWHTIEINAEGMARYGNLNHDIYLGSQYSFKESTRTKFVSSSASISFVVDEVRPTTPPNVTLLSPTNTTYYYIRDWTHIPYVRLNYQSEDTRLSVGYSFDGDSNITPATNGTRLDIPIRSHSLTFYANDTFGNSATPQTVQYKILRYKEPTLPHSTRPSPDSPNEALTTYPSESFPTTLVDMRQNALAYMIAMVASSTIISAALLLYFKKRKH